MEKVLITDQHDYWYFREEYGSLNFSLLVRSRFLNDVSYFDSITDQAGNPHIIAEKGGFPKYYFWNGVSWIAGPHPERSFVYPYHLAVLENNQVTVIAYQKKAEVKSVFQLFLQNGCWSYEKIAVLPDGAVIIAAKSLGQKGLLVIYTYWEGIREFLGLAVYGQGNWRVIDYLPVEGKLLSWFYEPEKLYFLLGEVYNTKKVLSLLRICLAEGKETTKKIVTTVPGWDGPPGIFSGPKGQLKICWTYLGKISLADLEREELMLMNQRESEVFYPAEIITCLSVCGRKPFSSVVLKKIHGIKLEPPLVVTIDALEKMCWKESIYSLQPHPAQKGLNYKLKVVRSSRP